MSEEDVNRAVIKPMRALYPPPRHLRGDEDAFDAALGAYRKALSRSERSVLEVAWERVVREHHLWCWPNPADIVQAAEQAQRAGRAVDKPDAWVEEAAALAAAYTRRFMQTTLAGARARDGGYAGRLKAYVEAAAWVQAQYVIGRAGVAYTGSVLFPLRGRDKEAEGQFFDKAREQAATGHIRVTVPRNLVELWKEEAVGKGLCR